MTASKPNGGRYRLEKPRFFCFSFNSNSEYIPADTTYPVWSLEDLENAAQRFRHHYGSHGKLTAFVTDDFIEWRVWGNIPEKTAV